jgi:F-type H+-transporting ATPase subunit c
MKKLATILLLATVVLVLAPAAYAADASTAGAGGFSIPAALSMAIAAGACGIAQSRVAGSACEGIGRNPGAADAIRGSMILGLVFVETLALFTLVIIFAKS